jgi:hypothetical protein
MNTHKKQTAIEWLINEIATKHDKSFMEFYAAEIQQALNIEKEQILDSARIARQDDFWEKYESYESYYKEIYEP